MKLTTFIVLCLIGGEVTADYMELRRITGITLRDSIFARQQECVGTCVECYGAGMVSCDGNACYNPSAGEVCVHHYNLFRFNTVPNIVISHLVLLRRWQLLPRWSNLYQY
jgi:hypothetical protein